MSSKLFITPLTIILCVFFGNLSWSEENTLSPEQIKSALMEAVDATVYGQVNGKFTCPRYLLRWSMDLFNQGGKEKAIKIAGLAKKLAELSQKNLTISKNASILPVKDKMTTYTKIIIEVASGYIQYFETSDEEKLNSIDNKMNELDTYNKEIEALLNEPIAQESSQITHNAMVLCPRWLITFAEGWQSDETTALFEKRGYQKFSACGECAQVIEIAKEINQTFKDISNIENPACKKPFIKYMDASLKMDDALIEYFRTGDEKLSEASYKYQEEALKAEKELNIQCQ